MNLSRLLTRLTATAFVKTSPLLFVCALSLHPRFAVAEDNPYASNYQAQNQGNLHSMQTAVEPQLYMGKKQDEDTTSMLENGYDLMGFSSFEAEAVAPEMALVHGRNILADRILVYVKKAGNQTPAMTMEVIKEAVKKGKELTEKDVAASPNKYRYYASFWAKLPPPVLGVHVIKLVPKKSLDADEKAEAITDAEGVKIIAVIHGSAAEQAGVLRDDQLLKINGEKVIDAANLSKLVQRFRGKAVNLSVRRQGEALSLPAQL